MKPHLKTAAIAEQARADVLAHYGLLKRSSDLGLKDFYSFSSPLRRAAAGFLSGSIPGAVVGAAGGALTAGEGESRGERALKGALIGGFTMGGANALRHGAGQYLNIRRAAANTPGFLGYKNMEASLSPELLRRDKQRTIWHYVNNTFSFGSDLNEFLNKLPEYDAYVRNTVKAPATWVERLTKTLPEVKLVPRAIDQDVLAEDMAYYRVP